MIELAKYEFYVPGKPVPKSTHRPPKGADAYWIVQTNPKYGGLRRTWDYQKEVKMAVIAAKVPQFTKYDPLQLSLEIKKVGWETGDRKNITAAIEDGIQYSGLIPNDRQITASGPIRISYNCGEQDCGVWGILELDPRVLEYEWLLDWFRGSKRRTLEYQRDVLGMDVDVETRLKELRKSPTYWWNKEDSNDT